jgi:hypothetical protein
MSDAARIHQPVDDIDRVDRVRTHTPHYINERIDLETEARVRQYAGQPASVIWRRIEALDREWDVERVPETNAATLGLATLVPAVRENRPRLLLLTGGILAFLLQHGIQGWCPPVGVLRRLGIRTRREIDAGKAALRVLVAGSDTAAPGQDGELLRRAQDRLRELRS